MPTEQVKPYGVSYRGPIAVLKGKKLTLPQDLYNFLVKAMKSHRGKDVLLTIHPIEPAPESILDFMEKLCDRSSN